MTTLKILVFEFITGGGLTRQTLPKALVSEGLLMAQALLDNLSELPATADFIFMLDNRLSDKITVNPANIQLIHAQEDYLPVFIGLIAQCDAVWVIAPETGGILHELCKNVEQQGKLLLTSSSAGAALAGNKWLTYQRLKDNAIATVPTFQLDTFTYNTGDWLIKPSDGVSCENSYRIANLTDFITLTSGLNSQNYLIQPHLNGEKTSLCCLFSKRKAWLICVNQQNFQIVNNQYQLVSILVNIPCTPYHYQKLADRIANAMPELWGYVGIDLIETMGQRYVLEINPRLTTSFAGIRGATGINCVEQVMALLTGEPPLRKSANQTITLNLGS